MKSPNPEMVISILCSILRDEKVEWPPVDDTGFYKGLEHQATYHGVDALACHLLKNTPYWEQIPESTRDLFLLRVRQCGAMEMVRKRDLLELLSALSDANVSILLLKGSALAYTHYPEPHLRTRVDTDIFISPSDIYRVKQVFARLGHQNVGRTYKSHQFNSVRTEFGGGSINYDVHWRSSNVAAYARVFGFEEALRKSISIPGLEGARALKPAHALLQACIHRSANPRHDPDRLIWLYDIHLLVSGMSNMELVDFADRAVRENLQDICLSALKNAHTRFATDLLPELTGALDVPLKAHDSFSFRFSSSQLGLIVDDLRELPNARSRLALVFEYLFPSGDYLLERYKKESLLWVPFLYLRYLAGGVYDRLSLR